MTKYNIKTHSLSNNEIRSVAEIHANTINLGFLSQLGPGFLYYLYKSIYECPQTELILAKDNDLTVGFITGCSSLKPVLKHLVKKYLIQTTISLIPQVIKPSNVKRIFEIITYSTKENSTLTSPSAELLSLAVIDSYRGSGVAKYLFEELQKQLKLKGFSEFKIIVGVELIQAQRFYERMGATKFDTIDLHKNSTSLIYKASTG